MLSGFLFLLFFSVATEFIITHDAFCTESRSSLGLVPNKDACKALVKKRDKADKGFFLKCPDDGETQFACHPCETTETEHSSCGSTSYFFTESTSCEDVHCGHGECKMGECFCESGWRGSFCTEQADVIDGDKRTLAVTCDPASQQTFCRVFCGEKDCDGGFCTDQKQCKCDNCPENECGDMDCNGRGEAMKYEGKCQCICRDGWEGNNCQLQPESPSIPSGFKGLPKHKCNQYVTIGQHETSTVDECKDLYNGEEDYSMGFFLDCYDSNRGSTMKCQACTTTEVSESRCGTYTFQPVIDCNPTCENGGVCHEDGHCLCSQDFRGSQCQDKIPEDLCEGVSCVHGGHCYAGRCQDCDEGYIGGRCEEEDGCKDMDCNEPHGFCDMGSCRCHDGWLGMNCQIWAADMQANTVGPPKHTWHQFLLIMIALSFVGFWVWLFVKYKRSEYKAFGDYTELVSYQNYGLAETPKAHQSE